MFRVHFECTTRPRAGSVLTVCVLSICVSYRATVITITFARNTAQFYEGHAFPSAWPAEKAAPVSTSYKIFKPVEEAG